MYGFNRTLSTGALLVVLAGTTACTSTAEMDALRADVDRANAAASQAAADAAAARAAADAARATAEEAKLAAEQARSASMATDEKLDRMFKKSMQK